jgi:hypothetical protein
MMSDYQLEILRLCYKLMALARAGHFPEHEEGDKTYLKLRKMVSCAVEDHSWRGKYAEEDPFDWRKTEPIC